jgi:hypothetical protein
MADTKNAHLRGESKSRREQPDIKAEEAQRILDDPAFKRGFEAVRNGYIKAIEEGLADGKPEYDMWEREICRSLRTLYAVKRNISLAIQGQTLRLAEFQSKKED